MPSLHVAQLLHLFQMDSAPSEGLGIADNSANEGRLEAIISLYAKVWFSFRVLANLAGKTHKSAPNLVQIEQIPRYHPHILKTPSSFIFEAIQTSALHEGNPEFYLACLKLLLRILKMRFNFTSLVTIAQRSYTKSLILSDSRSIVCIKNIFISAM